MSARGQRGQTLVELLVGITVTGIVLAALAGLLFTVSDRFDHWSSRVQNASDGADVASAIQADGHRYAVCASGSALDFCIPGRCGSPVVTYDVHTSGSTYVITRSDSQQDDTFVGRLPDQPQFTPGQSPGLMRITWGAHQVLVYLRSPGQPCS